VIFTSKYRAFWAFALGILSIVCWVAMPCASAFNGGEEEVVWLMSDADDERGEENKQGEEEAADDEVKKWSEWSDWNPKVMSLTVLSRSVATNRQWSAPYRRGVFEPPEMMM